jgi:hypothetical protein
VSLGPNALLPCGTDSARRRHAAHGELCATCHPDDPYALTAQARRDRAAAGLSQRALAARAGVSFQAVGAMETAGRLRLIPRGAA